MIKVVLVDDEEIIRTAVMDGIQLVKEANYHQLPVKFILLSGYGEFEYAKAAMEYGVQHYILKPSDETQIIQALNSLIEKIQEEKQMLQNLNTSKRNMHKLLPTFAKKYLQENPEIKVIELCDALGFENNPTYLSTLFKNHTGMTLTDYRKHTHPKHN